MIDVGVYFYKNTWVNILIVFLFVFINVKFYKNELNFLHLGWEIARNL